MRDKNPKIRPGQVGTYTRDTTIPYKGADRNVRIEYLACLIDPEDVTILHIEDLDGSLVQTLRDICDVLLAQQHSEFRAGLAEYADYAEAHR